MSDFSSEVNEASLSLMGKVVDALLKLMGKIYEAVRESMSIDNKLKKQEYKEMKANIKDRAFAQKIQGKTGFVSHKKLERAGVPLTVVGISLDNQGMKELAKRCKREGIIITGVQDMREKSLKGNKTIILECRQSDLKKLARLIDLMNDEKKIQKLNEKTSDIKMENQQLKLEMDNIKKCIKKQNGEITPEQSKRLEEIEQEMEENNSVIKVLDEEVMKIREGHSREHNEEQTRSNSRQEPERENGEGGKKIEFDEAIDHWTGGEIDRDTTCYIVDAKNPDNYIVATASNDIFNNEEYIKTNYEVYNAGNKVYDTHDGYFDNRPEDYWKQEKSTMKEKGGIGDFVLKFYSLEELEKYKEKCKAENDKENESKNDNNKDYDETIKGLENKLEECNAIYAEGTVVDKDTKEPLVMKEGMSDLDRLDVAEAMLVGKQIENYKNMKDINLEIAIARTEVLTTDEGSAENIQAKENLNKLQDKYKDLLSKETNLIEARKDISAAKAYYKQQADNRENNKENNNKSNKENNKEDNNKSNKENNKEDNNKSNKEGNRESNKDTNGRRDKSEKKEGNRRNMDDYRKEVEKNNQHKSKAFPNKENKSKGTGSKNKGDR